MNLKKGALFAVIVLIYQVINAQGVLKGKVTDGKEPIPYANIVVLKDGKINIGAQTDFDGYYTIKPISPGKYEVKASCMGYQTTTITGVQIDSNKITFLDIKMNSSAMDLESVEVLYERPLIEKDVSSVKIRGDRSADVVTYVDGVKVSEGKKGKSEKRGGKEGVAQTDPKLAHLLTAGEVNDFTKWVLWNDISKNELAEYAKLWNILPQRRFCVQLTNEAANPVSEAKVRLLDSDKKVVWEAKTDNTGKAELWGNLFSIQDSSQKEYSIAIEYRGQDFKIKNAIPFNQGVNTLKLPVACEYSNNVDVMFMVDATGSMGDEIKYLKAELLDIINNVKKMDSQLSLNLGAVFYRDKGDAYVTRKSDLSSDINQAISFINQQDAGGGGDYEEAVEEALQEAIVNCNWRVEARTRILFMVLDAPPHPTAEVLQKMEKLIALAAQKGIRIIPISGSGVSKGTEYLLRSMALGTNGTYTFLTDDSGIGGPHIKPTTDSYKVELLNDLMIRLFKQYTSIPECNKPIAYTPTELQPDTAFILGSPDSISAVDTAHGAVVPVVPEVKPTWKYYPNPTRGELNVEILGKIVDLFLTDNAGKILQRIETNSAEPSIRLDLSEFPNGLYLLRYYYEKERSVIGKVILNR